MPLKHMMTCFVLLLSLFIETGETHENAKLPQIVEENFSDGAARWTPTDPEAWVMKSEGGKHFYSLIKKRSDYEPPVRSPYNRAILKEVVVSDFVMDVTFRSTIPDYNHRDLCLFFGYQDESHFYYVHFGKKTDDHANQIFIVNEKPRTKISTKTTPGTDWDDEWHHARIERSVESGEIKVYFDDMQTPVMTATDKTFTWGQVGIGSFDDTGDFEVVQLRGTKVRKP
ncbi:MAG: hypothetical protein HUJ26_12435 [Planctomycetaceae bacterium]|nr:hypothetical protein [Planctomycetaceae bacterium]